MRLLPPKGKPQNVTHMYLCTHMYTYVSCFFVFSSLSSITECGGTFVEPMLNMMSCILHPYDAGHVWRGLPHFRRSWDRFASQYHPINYYPLSDSPARKTMQGVGGETLQLFTFSTAVHILYLETITMCTHPPMRFLKFSNGCEKRSSGFRSLSQFKHVQTI